MIKFMQTIDNFWAEDLSAHNYARVVPFVAKNFDHLDRQYYNRDNLLQSFDNELPNAQQFKDLFKISKGTISWTCILPNVILPSHKDTFYTMRQEYDIDITQCYRYLVFLEDWVFGHYAAFGSTGITHWKAGDVWKFDSDELHYAVNASNMPFHSCQISTFDQSKK